MNQNELVDLDVAVARMLRMNKQLWMLEASTKSKLRTFLEVHEDAENAKAIVHSNLSRAQRSLTAKIKLGILPLQLEVGRWKDDPVEYRSCRLCGDGTLENEFHFIMYCDSFKPTRTQLYQELHAKSDIDLYGKPESVLKGMLSKGNIKIFARYLEQMWSERSLLYVA